MKKLNVVIFGTGEISSKVFDYIYNLDFINIKKIVTMPDRVSGRGNKKKPPELKTWGIEKNIEVIQKEKILSNFAKKISEDIDLFLVVAFGKIFSSKFISSSPKIWNLHFSLLPKYRGSSPVQSAILNQEKVSGITIFEIQKGVDTGKILKQKELNIENLRADEVFEKMVNIGNKELEILLKNLNEGLVLKFEDQNNNHATQCGKFTKEDGFLDFNKESVNNAYAKILAFFPWPSTYVIFNKERLKIIKAKKTELKTNLGLEKIKNKLYLGFKDGSLEVIEIQREGKKAVQGTDFANSYFKNVQ